jgi:hypothetical protein
LTEGEVFHAHLIKLSVKEAVLVLAPHHMIAEARTTEILWEKVMKHYHASFMLQQSTQDGEGIIFSDRLQLE